MKLSGITRTHNPDRILFHAATPRILLDALVFNRPELTSQVYERVRAAKPRRLLLASDNIGGA